ncbi:MAG TPA: hypothetical protein VH796_03200 [Nitrososphaeraceae archaeon]|jgi:hypothetical protein
MTDSYMGIFVPADISSRILRFIDGKIDFPILSKHELMAIFYLFGKDYGISDPDLLIAVDLAKRTVSQLDREIKTFAETASKLTTESVREIYNRRVLQLHAEGSSQSFDMSQIISRDPTILSACYVQHIAYYNQKFFFELFPQIKKDDIPLDLHIRLFRRMVLVGYNIERVNTLSFGGPLNYFYEWFKKH